MTAKEIERRKIEFAESYFARLLELEAAGDHEACEAFLPSGGTTFALCGSCRCELPGPCTCGAICE